LIFRIIIKSIRDFIKDEGTILAGSISFNFLLSSIPFIILLGSLMGYTFEYLQNIYEINSIESSEIILNYIRNIFPMVKDEALNQLFNIKNYRFPLSIIGFFGLLFTSTLLFEVIKHSFIKILKCKLSPHFLIARLVGFLVIFIIIIISFFLENIFSIFFDKMTMMVEKVSFAGKLLQTIEIYGFLISFVVTALFSFILYYIFIRIFARDKNYSLFTIGAGTLFFSLTWNAFKYIYTFYLSKVTYLNIIYGSFTSIVIIFIWVYFTSVLFLVSIEVIKNTHLEKDRGEKLKI